MDAGGKQPFLTAERMDRIERLAARGAGIVHLHQVIEILAARALTRQMIVVVRRNDPVETSKAAAFDGCEEAAN